MKTIAMLTAGLLAAWMGEAMAGQDDTMGAMPQALVINPEPLAPNERLATLDIVSEQGQLGGDQSRLGVREGQITVGQPLLYVLEEPTENTAHQLPGPDDKRWRFYLVVFRFTLHPPPGERRYREMVFKVALSDSQVTAFQLLPERVVSEEDVTKSFDIGFSISLPGGKIAGPASSKAEAKATRTVRFTQLRPVIEAYGDGEKEFYWHYRGPSPEMPVEPGARRVAAVLQVPIGLERLSATILWNVDLERSIFDEWRNMPVRVDALPLELSLR